MAKNSRPSKLRDVRSWVLVARVFKMADASDASGIENFKKVEESQCNQYLTSIVRGKVAFSNI